MAPYQTAVIRIGFSATWLLFLVREFPHRDELYGPDAPWSWNLAEQLIGGNHAFTPLMWNDSRLWFEIVYVFAVLASFLLMLGWRTRTMSVLFMIGVMSLQNRNIFVGDGGDNVLHLMSVYLVFTRCGQVWSLDARRARTGRSGHTDPTGHIDHTGHTGFGRTSGAGRIGWIGCIGRTGTDPTGLGLWAAFGVILVFAAFGGRFPHDERFVPVLLWTVWVGFALWWLAGRIAPEGGLRILLDVAANVVHNAALLVIMAETCLIYSTAGWYKIQGSRWGDGTAVYYPLQLDYFSPWPALGNLLTGSGLMVMLVTYGTVIVQVAFPFTLLHRKTKNVLLAALITEHLAIAVILGLPFFSMAMITADSVFLPTSLLHRVGRWAARARGRVFTARERDTVPASEAAEALGASERAPGQARAGT